MAKIFIADNEPEINRSLKSFFGHLGYDTEAAKEIKNADSIVKEARLFNPDMALLDVRINKVLNLEVIKQIKNANKAIKIIVMSSYMGDSEKDTIHEILTHGADNYLAKPIDLNELMNIVKESLV
ncbi:MAG: response regulator [Candidatus Omnitrophica bacterium]|nr:response regulator [Candidatus Omnitrophota bacterium]